MLRGCSFFAQAMILVHHWIGNFPGAQKEAIADALESRVWQGFAALCASLKKWIRISAVRSWVWNYLAPLISSLSFRYYSSLSIACPVGYRATGAPVQSFAMLMAPIYLAHGKIMHHGLR